ncbi:MULTISPECIES: chorismate-binding protein [unclassified Actinomyces]|uniref:isochorismate synthase n=1 Tax=unclassified Actinomyces TaxID=2609248 RepID=UPI002017AD15|nr:MULTISPECIES: chorismate-binding protein [unclassified Actinomyces]MCL3776931.1 chorismate-binding protein [Actinomyces sp. AC-20-1]MCL3789168.1 chorismate-binding protein [Actinomyces sp. 187325]MCL3791949.1 chorismate-binding protein [Actinomyces sp. 186855]MCL3794566.1 chorismate-binding protein [Actinomyces sp. 217892]
MPPARLFFRTERLEADQVSALGLDAPGGLVGLLAGRGDAVSWVRHGRGLVGWGRLLEIEARGEDRVEELRAAWREVVYASWWRDPLVRPGTGPVALGAITFSARSAQRSVLLVPRVLIGLDDEGAWVTTAAPSGQEPAAAEEVVAGLLARGDASRTQPPARPPAVEPATVAVGSRSDDDYLAGLRAVQERMRAGEADKVVIARDVLVTPAQHLPTGDLLARLAHGYPSCWTFSVDGMVGASPELLVRIRQRRLESRVLAGTARRRPGTGAEREAEAQRLAAWLEADGKNNREHALARASAIEALEPLCSVVEAPERFVLTLPNVLHLASDVRGVVAGDTGALSLVGALHPTAAVGGTPTPAAVALIDELEGMDRGRYAGPVGWVDWHGEGEWCIALRSAELSGQGAGPGAPARVFGGGGIMPDSDPEDELAETRAKMRPVLSALGAG